VKKPARASQSVTPYCGSQLRHLRTARRFSQMALALTAGVSARHVGFIELGRASPGRDVLLRLGAALSLTSDELASLLAAAGFAHETPPRVLASKEQLAPILAPVRALLDGLGKLPAALVDGHWDILLANAAYLTLSKWLGRDDFPGEPLVVTEAPRPNRVRELFDPAARSRIQNWTEVAGALVARVRQEERLTRDPALADLLEWALTRPGTPREWRDPFAPCPTYPIRVDLILGSRRVRLYSVVNAWATAFPGLRVEFLQPVDEPSERALDTIMAGPEARPWVSCLPSRRARRHRST
jgi:transcriptional regulator with XRE-family HTH domain